MVGSSVQILATVKGRTLSLATFSAVCLALPLFNPLTFPLAWFGLIPLLIALQTRRWQVALMASFLFGVVFHGLANYWLVPTIAELAPFANSTAGAMMVWAVVGSVALLVWQSLFSVLFGISFWCFRQRLRNRSSPFIVGFLWLLTEWLRSLGTFGYPWALLASTQIAFSPILQIAAWVGSFGLSGAIAFTNALFFEWWQQRKSFYFVSAMGFLIALCLLGWLDGERMEKLESRAPRLNVAVIQGNFGMERWRPDVTFEELKEILKVHLSLSEKAVSRGAKLIVWSETALPWRLRENGVWGYGASSLQRFAEQYRSVLFVGAGEWNDGKSYNSCFVFAPKGMLKGTDVYRKIRLVPFGEYLPGRRWFPWLAKILPHAPIETASGEREANMILRVGNKTVKPGIAICFESLFPFHVRQLVGSPSASKSAANLIVIITNDSWFGETLAPYHHARVAVLRAIEMRRTVVRGAGTGISLIVSPTGKILRASKWGERCILTASVPLIEKSSGYLIWGDLPAIMVALVGLALIWLRR